MRWVALGVDYEMAGKDLIDSVKLSGQIARALGGEPPEGFNYELFLDEKGQKISKSKGNGLTIDEWLAYATPESLALFMYNKPREAKRLFFDVIPRAVDEYLNFLERYPRPGREAAPRQPGLAPACRRAAVARDGRGRGRGRGHDAHLRDAPEPRGGGQCRGRRRCSGASSAASADGIGRETHPRPRPAGRLRAALLPGLRAAGQDLPGPDAEERAALAGPSRGSLAEHAGSTDPEALQAVVYEVGRRHFPDLSGKAKSPDGRPGVSQAWFTSIYNVLFGEARGPRFGSFIALYGVAEETRALIGQALSGELERAHAAFTTGLAKTA